jgi:hypothetical protein
MSELDDYYEHISPLSRSVIRQQQAQAEAEGVDVSEVWARERAAQKLADQAAQAQRDAAAAAALAAVTPIPMPEGAHPAMAPVYRELNRQALEAARAPAVEAARRQAEAAARRAEEWRQWVYAHPNSYAFDGTPRNHDPAVIPAWF